MLLEILPFYSKYLEPASAYSITNIVQNFPFVTILLSLFIGIVCLALKPKTAMKLVCFNMIVCFVLGLATLLYCVERGDYYIYMMGQFPAPFGNEIRVGVLEALMATAFALVMLLSLMGGLKHIFHDVLPEKQTYYFLMMEFLFTSLIALIYTNDLFTAYVFVEINTLTACAIVMLKHSKETLVATARYLMMSLLGSGLIMIGISILYDISGHLLMEDINAAVVNMARTGEYKLPLEVVICLFAIGLGIKSALYPFHSWLPDAHGTSTSGSSAVLSGLVLKAYIILLIKMVYRVFGMEVILGSKILNVLFALGILAMTIGSIKAINSRDLKRMIAYSSVAQIGYIYLGIGLGPIGMVPACLQILVHAYTKPMLFNTAGAFMDTAGGSRKFKDLVGAARKNLWAGIGFAVGAFSMIGIPLFAGFVVKYNLAVASLATTKIRAVLALVALVISTVLNAIYYVPALMVLFRKSDKTKNILVFGDEPDVPFIISNGVFIVCNFVLGICSFVFIDLIEKGLAMFA